MQPERQISVALIAVASALVIPAFLTLSRNSDTDPGMSLAVGAIIGSLGTLLGSLLAADHPARSARILGLGFWIVLALAISGATWFGAVHSTSWVGRIIFGIAGLLPIVGPVLALRRVAAGQADR